MIKGKKYFTRSNRAGPGNWRITMDLQKFSICQTAVKILGLSDKSIDSPAAMLRLLGFKERWYFVRDLLLALEARSEFDRLVRITTDAGEVKWIRITGVLSYKRWGNPEKMVGVIRDVTQQVTEEATALTIINHELRDPLTIIKLNTQMAINLLDTNLHKDIYRLLSRAEFFTDLMTNVLEEYNSGSGDKALPGGNRFDISQLIERVIAGMKTIHPRHRFETSLPDICIVRGDKYKIVQVLVNYLTNAVNYSPDACRIIIMATEKDGQVAVSVRDQGIGIPLGAEFEIFEKYYRGSENLLTNRGHKGLGLYLVKEIVKQHGGRAWAERASGKGSVFYFTLPLAAYR